MESFRTKIFGCICNTHKLYTGMLKKSLTKVKEHLFFGWVFVQLKFSKKRSKQSFLEGIFGNFVKEDKMESSARKGFNVY